MNSRIKNGILMIVGNMFMIFRLITGNQIKYKLYNLISPGATIITRNKGTIVLGRCTIRKNSELSVDNGKIIVGNGCFINRNCILNAHEKLVIGDKTTIGPGVYIYDHDHDGNGKFITKPITIGKNVWIGAGVIILKGVTIGDNAVIGAGSIVTKNIEAGAKLIQKRMSIYVRD